MEIVQIRITSTVVTAPYGTIMPGTILRTDAEYARFWLSHVKPANTSKHLQMTKTSRKNNK